MQRQSIDGVVLCGLRTTSPPTTDGSRQRRTFPHSWDGGNNVKGRWQNREARFGSDVWISGMRCAKGGSPKRISARSKLMSRSAGALHGEGTAFHNDEHRSRRCGMTSEDWMRKYSKRPD